MRTKKPPHHHHGLKIGETECPSCGANLPLKVNTAGGVYYFCAAVLSRDENGKATDKCMTRFNFGRAGSKRMINEFLEQNNVEKPENTTEEQTNREVRIGHNGGPAIDEPAEGKPETARGSEPDGQFGSKLREFLTGS